MSNRPENSSSAEAGDASSEHGLSGGSTRRGPIDSTPPIEGMGPQRNGPDFTQPTPQAARAAYEAWQVHQHGSQQYGSQQYGSQQYGSGYPPAPAAPQTGDAADRFRPPTSKKPTVITAVAVIVVALVVTVATIAARQSDQRAETTPTPTVGAQVTPGTGSIDFSSSEGDGRLTVVNHAWVTDTTRPAGSGQFLQLEVEIACSEGRISYDPSYFQAFDSVGNIFDTAAEGAKPPFFGSGRLRPGESTRGVIAFDIPRGEVTLLLSNGLYEAVTALKIED